MTTTDTSISGGLVNAIEYVWNEIRHRHPDVPPVIITIGSGTLNMRGGLRYGHFAAARWIDRDDLTQISELFIGGEGMKRGAVGILGTLLHEAGHGIAWTRDIPDTSRGGRYHNSNFKEIASEVGITVKKVGDIGWSETSVPQETELSYMDQVLALHNALKVFRAAEVETVITGPDGNKITLPTPTTTKKINMGGRARKSNNNGVSLSCGCRKIRLSVSAAELGDITCNACGGVFH